ncbi:hypothetical protein TRICHSKD4_2270 [Roseibium sp. TrichSKD4]|uniref:hypothetical protein n=1 Tax=Roseibium sp. TrichSKD4 TaxID=744980 RepID=UPI0001E56937|nr:hypothetical protein [Roseibium sp. TrichSKD4]EFO32471.1 hypothetical protein TRICHSKD4_2270 [Roseibium sp. TrichSKD4]
MICTLTYQQAALAIGYRALGESPTYIAAQLKRDEAEIRKLLNGVAASFEPMLFAEDLLYCKEPRLPIARPRISAKPKPAAASPPAPQRRPTRAELFRKWKPVPVVSLSRPQADVTAELMGDPPPGRSAASRSAHDQSIPYY